MRRPFLFSTQAPHFSSEILNYWNSLDKSDFVKLPRHICLRKNIEPSFTDVSFKMDSSDIQKSIAQLNSFVVSVYRYITVSKCSAEKL